jgi:Flp pilus assembly pilin Flp
MFKKIKRKILKSKCGQTAVEYLLLLAFAAGFVLMFGTLFHQKLLGGFFTLIGLALGVAD